SSCAEFVLALTGAARPETPHERPRQAAAQPRRSERRAAVRFQTTLDSRCQPVALVKEKCWSARVNDISVGGLRLIVPRRFEPGTLLTVRIDSPDLKSHTTQLVRVVRLSHDKPRQWTLGCVFIHPLNAAELKSIL